MPRRVQLKPWRGDRWKSYVYHGIERRVRNSLDSIAAPLNLDGSAEQEALVEAVTIELRRAWAYLREVQSAASDPAALHILKALLRAEDLVTKVEQADPNVRRLIEEHDWFSRGKASLEEIATDPSRLRKATSRALRAVTKSKTPNRPRGTAQFAEHVLAESLSGVFEQFGGRATRRHDAYGGYEYGPYREFVTAVLGVVPKCLLRSPGRIGKYRNPLDYMVRLSARHVDPTPKKPSVSAGFKGDLLSILPKPPPSSNSSSSRNKT
jgi:hypothetical protein